MHFYRHAILINPVKFDGNQVSLFHENEIQADRQTCLLTPCTVLQNTQQTIVYISPPDKSAYEIEKYFSYSSTKTYKLWVLKRTVSMRRFF